MQVLTSLRSVNATLAHAKTVATCQSLLYPQIPPIPKPVPIASYAGTYYDPGYGNVTVTLACNQTTATGGPNSPAHPTIEDGCFLRITPRNTARGFIGVEAQHVFGDYWIAWPYLSDYTGYRRPWDCLPAQFKVNAAGKVTDLGLFLSADAPQLGFQWLKRIS
jgi:hypothetical protein